VRLGKPKNSENYQRLEIEGILIYFKANLADLFGIITIKIEKLLFIKFLVATGAK
jgi:hypothetical protein